MRQSLVLAVSFLALFVAVAVAETVARREPVEVASAPIVSSPAVSISGATAGHAVSGHEARAAVTPGADATVTAAPTSVPTPVPTVVASAAPATATPEVAATTPAARTATAHPGKAAPAPTSAPTTAPDPGRAGAGQVTSRGSAASHKVGLQVGHWRREEAGPPFSRHSGSSGGGKTEDEVNLGIARATAEILKDFGYGVDILPTLIPKGYSAELVVAIHADGGPSSRRGFFTDRPVRSGVAADEARLARILDEEYARATGIPHVYRGTENSQYYYGYYAVNPRTPMVLIETGFLTNDTDRLILLSQPEVAATGIARAIRRFLVGG